MTITEAIEHSTNTENIINFLYDETLGFFKKYPYARFSTLAVVNSLNKDKPFIIKKILDQLVSNHLISTYKRNNINLYSLNH
jgi:hypothetical protein